MLFIAAAGNDGLNINGTQDITRPTTALICLMS